MTYDIWCFVDLGELHESVRTAMSMVNDSLKEFGITARYGSRFKFGKLTVDREMTDDELEKLKSLIGGEIVKSELHSKYGVRLDSIVKSDQSRSQSYNATNATQGEQHNAENL